MTWFPFRSLMSTTTCKLRATMIEWIWPWYLWSVCVQPPPCQWTGGKTIINYACLPPCWQKVNHLLDCSSSMHVERDINKVLRNRLANDVSLLISGIFQQLLTEVIAERIWKMKSERESSENKGSYQSWALQNGRKSHGKSCHGAPEHPLQVSFASTDNHVGPYTGSRSRRPSPQDEYQQNG